MSMVPPMRDRLYLVSRAAHVGRLTDRGLSPDAAERAVTAWETEAAARGLSRDDPTYWTAGEAWVLEAGADLYAVSRMLGHASIAATAPTYAHVTPAMQRRTADLMDTALG